MMDALSLAFVIYSSQILLVVSAAAMAEALLRRARPTVRLGYWRAIGVLCLALPLIASSGTNSPVATVTFSVLPAQNAAVQSVAKSLPTVAPIFLWIWAYGAIAALAWLLAGAYRVRQMRRRSHDGVSRTGRRRDADRAGARRAVSLVERCPATCDVWSAASGRPAAPALRGTDARREVRGGVPRAAPHQTARLVVDRTRSARARAVLVSSRGLVAARSCPAPARAGHRPARHRAHVNAARLHAGADDVRRRWTIDCALECVLTAAASEVASQSTREGEAHVCSTPAVHDGRRWD